MIRRDREIAAAIMAADDATRRAGFLTPLLARLFGERRVLFHLGYEHRLSRWRGRWYHVGIEEVG